MLVSEEAVEEYTIKGLDAIKRWNANKELDDLAISIDSFYRALSLGELLPEDRNFCLDNLAGMLWVKYRYTKELLDLDKFIAVLEELDPECMDLVRYKTLGYAYHDRFFYRKHLNDLDKSVHNFSLAFDLTSDQLPHEHVLYRRGDAYLHRYEVTDDIADLKNAIDDWELSTYVRTAPKENELEFLDELDELREELRDRELCK